MDIPHICNTVLTHTTAAAIVIKDTVIWTGRSIQSGFSNYLIPAVSKAWIFSMQGISAGIQYLQASALTSFSIAGTLFVISLTAFKISQSNIYQDSLFAKAAWKSIGTAAIIASTVATGFGIAIITAI